MTKRRTFKAAFNAKVAIKALQEGKPMAELSMQHGVHQSMIQKWKHEFVSRSSEVFQSKAFSNDFDAEREKLYVKIGQLEMEKGWLKKFSAKAGI